MLLVGYCFNVDVLFSVYLKNIQTEKNQCFVQRFLTYLLYKNKLKQLLTVIQGI